MDIKRKVYILLWNFQIGGAQKHAVLLSNFLIKSGYDVVILYQKKKGDLLSLLSERVELKAFVVPRTNNPFGLITTYLRLKKEVSKGSVILANGPNNFRQLSRLNFLFGRWRILYVLHNDFSIKKSTLSWVKILELKRLLNARNTEIVTLSLKQKEKHRKDFSLKNSKVIPNFIDFSHNHISVPNIGGPIGVSIGRFSFEKGYDILLDSVKYMCESRRIDVYGFGESIKKELESQASKMGINNVRFLPPRTDVFELLSQYDYYISPSRRESFGLSIVEALSCGLPVVTTDTDGPREIIDEKNGIIVRTESAKALAEGIDKMNESILANKYEPKKIRQSAEKFAIDIIGEEYIQLLN